MSHVSKSLAAYQDGELDRRAVQAVEAHLSRCDACRAELASLADLSALLHQPDPAPLSVSDAVFAAQVTLQLPREETETLYRANAGLGPTTCPGRHRGDLGLRSDRHHTRPVDPVPDRRGCGQPSAAGTGS